MSNFIAERALLKYLQIRIKKQPLAVLVMEILYRINFIASAKCTSICGRESLDVKTIGSRRGIENIPILVPNAIYKCAPA